VYVEHKRPQKLPTLLRATEWEASTFIVSDGQIAVTG
jgi:hypothetical protein